MHGPSRRSREGPFRQVAEGIERPERLAELQALGCGLGQGYLSSRPVDIDGVGQFQDNSLGLPGGLGLGRFGRGKCSRDGEL